MSKLRKKMKSRRAKATPRANPKLKRIMQFIDNLRADVDALRGDLEVLKSGGKPELGKPDLKPVDE